MLVLEVPRPDLQAVDGRRRDRRGGHRRHPHGRECRRPGTAARHLVEPAADEAGRRRSTLSGGPPRQRQRPAPHGLRAARHEPAHDLVPGPRHHDGHAGQPTRHLEAPYLNGPPCSARHRLDAAPGRRRVCAPGDAGPPQVRAAAGYRQGLVRLHAVLRAQPEEGPRAGLRSHQGRRLQGLVVEGAARQVLLPARPPQRL
mmetsp:Transcript_31436/g.90782  ORF Transcript_31436/g.90782 Transcript_31436/m.90782 type:complete len:200 (+) Transcript_31436:244-843(+)